MDEPIALDAYEQIADAYDSVTRANAYNAGCERPATLSLLSPLQGLHVLDAGCGPGHYAEWMLARGAQVTALDVSPRMVQLARQRLGPGVDVRVADLSRPLDLPDGSFDVVLAALVVHYVRDWDALFREFARVLRPGGRFVFSTGHPLLDYELHPADDYYAIRLVEDEWSSFGKPLTVRYWVRPLGALSAALAGAGFVIEQMLEPRPTEECRGRYPDVYEKLSKKPWFLCVRAQRIETNKRMVPCESAARSTRDGAFQSHESSEGRTAP
jgi:SAM-dependent methyltransferase